MFPRGRDLLWSVVGDVVPQLHNEPGALIRLTASIHLGSVGRGKRPVVLLEDLAAPSCRLPDKCHPTVGFLSEVADAAAVAVVRVLELLVDERLKETDGREYAGEYVSAVCPVKSRFALVRVFDPLCKGAFMPG